MFADALGQEDTLRKRPHLFPPAPRNGRRSKPLMLISQTLGPHERSSGCELKRKCVLLAWFSVQNGPHSPVLILHEIFVRRSRRGSLLIRSRVGIRRYASLIKALSSSCSGSQ